MDLLGFSLVHLLILNLALANTETTKSANNDWIPLIHVDTTTQIDLNAIQTKLENTWKASAPVYDYEEVKPNAIKIVTPAQFPIKNESTNFNLQHFIDQDVQSNVKETTSATVFDSTFEDKDPIDYNLLTDSPHLNMYNTRGVKLERNTERFQRTSKEIRNHNFVNDIRNLYENVLKVRTETTPTTTNSDYEVTEPMNEEETSLNLPGYMYKHPIVVPIGLTSAQNEFNAKLQENLKKYNINSEDMLNNYAISKSYVNSYDNMFQMYRSHIPSVIAIPFRYNRLNHLPVNPLLGVLLSNYGYYVQGSNGLPNYYRNFYGFTAPKIVNNRVTSSVLSQGLYQMLSDTDSSD